MDYREAAEIVRRMAVQYAGMVKVAEALDIIGGYDQAVESSKAVVEKADADRREALGQLDLANTAVAAARRQEAHLRARAQETAGSIINAAQAKADEIAAASGERAKAAAEAAVVAAGKDLEAVKGALGVARSELAAAEAGAKAATAKVAAKQKELGDIEAKIGAARESMRKLLGA